MRRLRVSGRIWRSALSLGLLSQAPAADPVLRVSIDEDPIMRRGDGNSDRTVDISDVIFIVSYLYRDGAAPPCATQADANADGQVNASDPVFLLNWLYNGGSSPPFPGPFGNQCVSNPQPSPSCQVDPCGRW